MDTKMVKQERPETVLKNFFETNIQKLNDILPKRVDPKSYYMSALNAIWKNPDLLKCDPYSLFKAVLEAAELGLPLGTSRGLAHLIPYGREVQMQIDYKGVIELASNNDNVADVRARSVYEKDLFDYDFGLEEKLIHKPYMGEDKGKPIFYYAIIRFKDGFKTFDVMSIEEIEKIRAKAKTQRVWNEWYDEMAKKTVLKRLLKTVPKYLDKVQEQLAKEDEKEYGAGLTIADTVKNITASKIEAEKSQEADSKPESKKS